MAEASKFETDRAAGKGAWAPDVLAEDARRLAEFHRSREGVPLHEVETGMKSWGTAQEFLTPRPRKL